MNDSLIAKARKFYTIEKQEFNYFAQKLVNKKHRFYTRDMFPPTYKSVLNPTNEKKLLDLHRSDYSPPGKLGFKQNELPEQIKMRFAENIKLQGQILDILKDRIMKFDYRCGLIKAKTGMGKTHICMDIMEYLQQKTLILVSNKKLMSEMIDKFTAMTNCKPGQYGDGKKELKDITVMTKSSFLKCDRSEVIGFKCILVDECHQGFTKKYRDKLNIFFHNQDIFLYGLSATPSTNELNVTDLEKYYGKLIQVEKDYDFIPEFTFYNYQHLEDYEFEHYAELRTLMSEDSDRYEKQKENITCNLSKQCSLILCDRLEEIDNWYNYLYGSHYYGKKLNVIKITGETKIEDDKKQLEESLSNGKPTIIIGSIQKCATGFDHPPIDTVFIFSAIKFENTVIQSIGRALRKHPGKTGAKIYVWNDKILDKQRIQKQKAIYEEYGVHWRDIENVYINKQRKQKGVVELTF